VKKSYPTIRKQGKVNETATGQLLVKNGQGLLPMVDLIEQCQLACDELIDVTGRATIQAVLQLSAMEAAGGPPQQGSGAPPRSSSMAGTGPGISAGSQAGSGSAALAPPKAAQPGSRRFLLTPPCRTRSKWARGCWRF